MTRAEAYWVLNSIADDYPNSTIGEALGVAMDLLESEDLLTEALEEGRLIFVKE